MEKHVLLYRKNNHVKYMSCSSDYAVAIVNSNVYIKIGCYFLRRFGPEYLICHF